MKSKIILFVLSALVWLGLTFNLRPQNIVIGFFVSLFVAFMIGDLFTKNPHKFGAVSRYLWFLVYVPVFVWEMIKANLDVAYRVIHPALPIRPGIVKVKIKLKSETGITFLANSITLTPGTMSVDYIEGYLYIHWINVQAEEPEARFNLIARRFENILEKIFE